MTERDRQWRDAVLMILLAFALAVFGADFRPVSLVVAGFAALSALAVALMILDNRNPPP